MDDGWADASGYLDDDAAALVDARLEAVLGVSTGPVNWRSLRSGETKAAWAALRGWVVWFRHEFAFDHRVVPPCWYRHSALVSVLSALFDGWRCAYDPLNTPGGASDWHETLIQLETRLRDWASRTGCTVGVHRADVFPVCPNDDEQWAAHVAGDVAARAEGESGQEASAAPQLFPVESGGARD